MPITTKHGSIFKSTADVLVCPVNCVGVMGAGLALEFKRRFPELYREYKNACDEGNMVPGTVALCGTVMLASTKQHWRNKSQVEWVEQCLIQIRTFFICWSRKPSIAIPQLGCGCGGLDWADVWPLYEKHLGDLPVDVEVWIYE